MSDYKDQADKFIEEVTIMQPSREWPPILLDDEIIKFEGSFDSSTWIRKNVTFSVIAFFVIVVITNALSQPIQPEGIGFIVILSFIGAAITFVMYRNQRWLITNRAIYVKKGRPMLISSARKIVGFGSTIRLIGGWGVGMTLLGVENASEIRLTLQGRTP